MCYPAGSPHCHATPDDRAGRVHQPAPSASSSRRLSVWSMVFAVLVLSGLLSAAAAQAAVLRLGANATTTTWLNFRAGPGTQYAVQRVLPPGASVYVNYGPFNTYWYQVTYSGLSGYVHGTYLTQSAPNGGVNLSQYPTSFQASGYTYTGRRAQVLHYLRDRFGTLVTTYAAHTDCPTCSADLWPPDGRYAWDNTGLAMMNNMAEHLRTNVGPLGIKYVIWNQHYSSGGAWIQMPNGGSITANHKNHVHINFLDSFQ